MPDSNESFRQHVEKEASQKLGARQSHLALFAAVNVVLPTECDALAIESHQPMIRDGDPMSMPAQVTQNLHWTAKSWVA